MFLSSAGGEHSKAAGFLAEVVLEAQGSSGCLRRSAGPLAESRSTGPPALPRCMEKGRLRRASLILNRVRLLPEAIKTTRLCCSA